MSVKLLTEHHLEFLSLKGGFTGWSESTLVKPPHCWKSHVTAQFISIYRTIHSVVIEMSSGQTIGKRNRRNRVKAKSLHTLFGPCRDKTCLRGFQQSEI